MSANPVHALEPESEAAIVRGLIERGRSAMAALASADQQRVDEAVTAVAWSIYQDSNAKALAELAVEDTGLGILGKIGEQTFAQAMQMVHYDLLTLMQRPYSAVLIIAALLTVGVNLYRVVKPRQISESPAE